MIPCQRHLFDLPDDVAWLNCAYTSPLMRSAVVAGASALSQKSHPWQISTTHFFDRLNTSRALFGQLVDCPPEQVARIPAVSYGIALAARNIPMSAGQTVVLLEGQFPSNVYAWRNRARETGARIVTVARPEDSDWTPAVLDAIDENTAVAALPNCHWTDGTLVDLVRVGERCRSVGAALVVDAIQSLGVMPFSVPAVQPDFLVTAAHKWLLGPYSFGWCYVAEKWCGGEPLEENWLNRQGSEDFSRLLHYQDGYQPGAQRFDVGQGSDFSLSPIADAALRQILDWGVANIAATLAAITARIADAAGAMGFTVPSTAVRAPHMLGIAHPDGIPGEVARRLAEKKIFVSIRGKAIRIAPHVYTSEADVDRLLETLRETL